MREVWPWFWWGASAILFVVFCQDGQWHRLVFSCAGCLNHRWRRYICLRSLVTSLQYRILDVSANIQLSSYMTACHFHYGLQRKPFCLLMRASVVGLTIYLATATFICVIKPSKCLQCELLHLSVFLLELVCVREQHPFSYRCRVRSSAVLAPARPTAACRWARAVHTEQITSRMSMCGYSTSRRVRCHCRETSTNMLSSRMQGAHWDTQTFSCSMQLYIT